MLFVAGGNNLTSLLTGPLKSIRLPMLFVCFVLYFVICLLHGEDCSNVTFVPNC